MRSSTHGTMKRQLEAFSRWPGADIAVSEVTRVQAGMYVSHLMENGKTASTNRDAVSCLATFFNWATRRGFYTSANPWAGQAADLRDPRHGAADRHPRRAWRPDELMLMATSLGPEDVRDLSSLYQ